jgi:YVTN family beta-propeller protein
MKILINVWSTLAGSTQLTSAFAAFALVSCFLQPNRARAASANGINTDATVPTNTVVANVSVGLYPTYAVVTPDSSTVYVCSNFTKSVSVIDAATNTVSSVISVGSGPSGLALTLDGSTLYVANTTDGTISVVDTSTNTVTTTLPVGAFPTLPTASPDGKSVYVPCATQIQIIDTTSNQIRATVLVPDAANPVQVLFNRDGTYAYSVCDVTLLRNGIDLDGLLQINTRSLEVTPRLWKKLQGFIGAVADSHDHTLFIGEYFLTGPRDMALGVFNTVTNQISGKISFIPYDGRMSGMPAVTSNGEYLYVPLAHDIIIADIATGKAVGEPIPIGGASFVAIAPNGKYAYVGANVGYPNSQGAVLVIAIGSK